MAEPTDFIATLLREIRREMREGFEAVDRRFDQVDAKLAEHDKRFEAVRQAHQGDSLLGRFATAEFDDRLQAIEKRLDALESRS